MSDAKHQGLPEYEVFAIKYAQLSNRRRSENFIVRDPHDGDMPMDYFVWVIRNAERALIA